MADGASSAVMYGSPRPTQPRPLPSSKQLTSTFDPVQHRLESLERQFHPHMDKLHPIWRFFAQQIAERPKWVAEATGIEWIGYGPDLKPPAPLPSFDELEKAWMTYAKCSELQRKKVKRAYKDFIQTMKLASLREITPELVVE